MSLRVPQPTKRFLRAAEREREGILVHHRRLEAERDRLLAEADRVNQAISQLDQRLQTLNDLLGPLSEGEPLQHERKMPSPTDPSEADPAGRMIAGPQIREAAVRVILQQPEYVEALHYRQWYERVKAAGFAVKGKNPEAVFLTQLNRSPVIRKSSEAGVYELDRQAPLRLRQRLERLQAELRDLTSSRTSDTDLSSARARRQELNVNISQTERALEEALRVLRPVEARSAPGVGHAAAARIAVQSRQSTIQPGE